MRNRYKKYISIYISFLAILITVIAMIWSSYEYKSDLKIITVLIGIFATLAGAIMSVFLKKLTTKKYRSKIFISHSYQDKDIADMIRRKLQGESFILNIDEKNILVGENIKETINKELEDSSIIIVLLSKNTSKSDYVKYETDKAMENGKKILPVLLDSNAEIPEKLRDIKYADLYTDLNKGIDNLMKALKYNLDDKQPAHNSRS